MAFNPDQFITETAPQTATFNPDQFIADTGEKKDSVHPVLGFIRDMIKDAGRTLGKQLTRLPGAIRGGAQAYQHNDPNQAADMAWQGFKDPNSVQSSEKMMENFGADTTKVPNIYTPPPGINNDPGMPTKPETTMVSPAQNLAVAFDNLAPTGLELLPPAIAKALGSMGGSLEHGATEALQSSLKPSKALRASPVPYESANFLTERPGAPEGGLGSALGKKATLNNITDFHNRIGDRQDAIASNMKDVDALQAIADAHTDINDAIKRGGDARLGISVHDAPALRKAVDSWLPAANEVNPSGLLNGDQVREFRSSLAADARYDHPDNTTPDKVAAATIRERLNEQIGKHSQEFRDLDRQFAETIPLRNAIADALGREGNKYPIGLRTSMVLASHGASIPAELAKMALIESTSRFGPQMAAAKAGRLMKNLSEPVGNFPAYMTSVAERDATQTPNLPPYLQRAQ